ncbi:hypothetical protein B0I37DRAFT_366063 [Chaetomium sp. MPI-CAGE-AT-0009]|nr:hypothetical protein B0I37DRAFT_366063 [Chaetomium sp. MPI-CAGE-AT-0009]
MELRKAPEPPLAFPVNYPNLKSDGRSQEQGDSSSTLTLGCPSRRTLQPAPAYGAESPPIVGLTIAESGCGMQLWMCVGQSSLGLQLCQWERMWVVALEVRWALDQHSSIRENVGGTRTWRVIAVLGMRISFLPCSLWASTPQNTDETTKGIKQADGSPWANPLPSPHTHLPSAPAPYESNESTKPIHQPETQLLSSKRVNSESSVCEGLDYWTAGRLIYYLVYYYTWVEPFCFEFPGGLRHLCTTMPWTIWPALVVLWGVCWMFIQQQHGGVDKSLSLPLQQGRQGDTEVLLSPLPVPSALDNPPWHGAWDRGYHGGTTFKAAPPRPSGAGNTVLQSYHPGLHAQEDWSAEWNADLSFDMDAIDFPTPNWPDNCLLPLPDVGGDEHELLTQEGDPEAQHLRSGTPGATPIVPNVLDPGFYTLMEHSLPLPTAAISLDIALSPPCLAQEPSPKQPSHAHNPVPALPSSSAGRLPHLPRIDLSIISYGPNQGPSTKKHQLLPTKSTTFRCPTCEFDFVRKETLDRHMREQKHGVTYAGPQDPEEHLCPTSGCRKSVRGKGFKRPEKLKEHLTKNETPSDDASSTEKEGTCVTGSGKGTPTIAERVAFLQRCRQADEEELRTLEQEIRAKERVCQQIRERILVSQSSLDMLMQHRAAPGM